MTRTPRHQAEECVVMYWFKKNEQHRAPIGILALDLPVLFFVDHSLVNRHKEKNLKPEQRQYIANCSFRNPKRETEKTVEKTVDMHDQLVINPGVPKWLAILFDFWMLVSLFSRISLVVLPVADITHMSTGPQAGQRKSAPINYAQVSLLTWTY